MPAFVPAFQPPAPIALVTIDSAQTGLALADVPFLLDSGADVSMLPRDAIQQLLDSKQALPLYEIEGFDGTESIAPAVHAEIRFLQKSLRGQFLVAEGSLGIPGRNILNSLVLLFDGPALNWEERRCTGIKLQPKDFRPQQGSLIDEVTQTSGLPVHRVLSTVHVLEMRGLVRRVSGNRVARV